MPSALRIDGLTKVYDDGFRALEDFDLDVPEGRFFGLLGPNGAGKTTLISAVCNIIRVTSGEIAVFGEPHGTLAARRMVGLAEQDVNLDRFLDVEETLLYHGGYFGMSRAQARSRAREMMDVFDLRAKAGVRAPKLSGGMRRRLLLACALMHEPRLVILDEPTAGVDFELRIELWAYIRRLHEHGTTVLLTTHYLEEADELCEDIALIRGGRVIARDTADGLRRAYDADSLADVYVKAMAGLASSDRTIETRQDGYGRGAGRAGGAGSGVRRRQSGGGPGMTSKRLGPLAVMAAAAVIWAIPAASAGKPAALQKASSALRDATSQLGGAVDQTLSKTDEALRKTREKTAAALDKADRADKRATTTQPATQPPLHGENPHAQGGVAVVDLNPSNERPLGAAIDGTDSGEDAIVGRARGEKIGGAYHGHITILTLLGQEVAGVDTAQGETKNGPLQPIQAGILDPLCTNTAQQVCLSVLTANSTTTAAGSDNDFAVARASVLGLGVGAAESHGTIAEDANCQASQGSSRVANVSAPGGGAVANVSDATTISKSCRGAATEITNTSHVIGLGGTQVPLPAAGCADGTADTVAGIPAILPIVCNAEDVAGAAAVREALDVFVLQVGSTSLTKATTASSEAISEAPAARETGGPQCSDTIDNDGDGVIDAADPGCHSDNDASNSASYNPNDNDETDKRGGGTTGSGGETGVQCADNRDNDGDGLIDERDGGCHTDGNPNNPDSYDPTDDSEAGGGGGGGGGGGAANAPTGGQSTDDNAELPFTGTDVVGIALAGLLLLAGGLLLRRREDTYPAL